MLRGLLEEGARRRRLVAPRRGDKGTRPLGQGWGTWFPVASSPTQPRVCPLIPAASPPSSKRCWVQRAGAGARPGHGDVLRDGKVPPIHPGAAGGSEAPHGTSRMWLSHPTCPGAACLTPGAFLLQRCLRLLAPQCQPSCPPLLASFGVAVPSRAKRYPPVSSTGSASAAGLVLAQEDALCSTPFTPSLVPEHCSSPAAA